MSHGGKFIALMRWVSFLKSFLLPKELVRYMSGQCQRDMMSLEKLAEFLPSVRQVLKEEKSFEKKNHTDEHTTLKKTSP